MLFIYFLISLTIIPSWMFQIELSSITVFIISCIIQLVESQSARTGLHLLLSAHSAKSNCHRSSYWACMHDVSSLSSVLCASACVMHTHTHTTHPPPHTHTHTHTHTVAHTRLDVRSRPIAHTHTLCDLRAYVCVRVFKWLPLPEPETHILCCFLTILK